MDDGEDADLARLGWIVWTIEVRDPEQRAAPDIGARTEQAMTEMAGSLGCVFSHCVDDDSYDLTPEGTYYSWSVRVPRGEHLRRNEHGVPIAVAALWDYLRTKLPKGLDDWHVRPDRDLSLRDAAADVLREAYPDLLRPMEVAMLGLRRDGAQNLDPRAECWSGIGATMAGSYALWVATDPGATTPCWLVLHVGMVPPAGFWSSSAGQRMSRFSPDRSDPVLILPRPPAPLWMATIETGAFTTNAEARLTDPHTVGARHEWTSPDAEQLAHRVSRDLQALFPRLAAP
ncbi:hypothetical protein LWC34_54665 [Kibdelosporangium philippinense]|uniref:DUF317 domain-containing protein n=2 Tax=Kibdelosporangium philippinense TaxID=211113 RepID=A0ABS8ZWW8_9PSEU|nr:hypothetical protein [Kibdelosporangium philippinense]MCE7011803.1 hypothetical protein [Kibdelosporangium philippinense]